MMELVDCPTCPLWLRRPLNWRARFHRVRFQDHIFSDLLTSGAESPQLSDVTFVDPTLDLDFGVLFNDDSGSRDRVFSTLSRDYFDQVLEQEIQYFDDI